MHAHVHERLSVLPSGPRWPQLIDCEAFFFSFFFFVGTGRLNESSASRLNEPQAHIVSPAAALKKRKREKLALLFICSSASTFTILSGDLRGFCSAKQAMIY